MYERERDGCKEKEREREMERQREGLTHYSRIGDQVGSHKFNGALRGTRRPNGSCQTCSMDRQKTKLVYL